MRAIPIGCANAIGQFRFAEAFRIFVFMPRLHATLLVAGHRARVDDPCVQPGPFPPPVVSSGYDVGAPPPPHLPAFG